MAHRAEAAPSVPSSREARRAKRRLGADPEAWDEAYRADEFARLHTLKEAPRYGIIGAWLRHLVPDDGHVLDGGCGEGALVRHVLRDRSGVHYTGFDVSAVALETARRVIGPDDAHRARLIRAGLADFEPPDPAERYDAIVLTEVLSYSGESVSWLPRFRRWLAADGVMVVTLQHPRRPDSGANGPFRAMHATMDGDMWTVLDRATLTNPRSGNAWDLWVFR
ncbi:methyltransferase [Roseospira marina]|uniref:Methyltransferase n=1 Tax=Roseospira marina TaxID=140057 RepID=A0A5M6IGV6_9PROT|nr:class I SAM-dependent methyltransferase [Roseospira marina]KAA5607536.1 methyltransferase [Roseospira marina]MBB4312279.1 cyclopropane fatty-acyl-phospholipid synthase-like methyltransferase [Roseospira marina]MBB5085705.1 cyclopropane fatty-acyl-phospholipid synthase-like methyltransferase [Roseospira marina]